MATPRATVTLLLAASALVLSPPALGTLGQSEDVVVLPSAPCAVPDIVMPEARRIDGGPNEAVRIRFTAAEPLSGTFAVWFALRAHVAEPSWPAERALALGFLETAAGAPVAVISPQLGIYPYGVQVDALAAGVRVVAAEGGCWGAFGALSDLSLAAGDYDLVVLGASEAGSRFAAFLPPEARVTGATTGPATMLSSATLACTAKARAFVSGALAEVLAGCATPLQAEGRSYRSLVATWGPTDDHDVSWTNPAGGTQRCYKAPNWCVDTGWGDAGAWSLQVPHYLTVQQPSPQVPLGGPDYSGLFGVFAGRP